MYWEEKNEDEKIVLDDVIDIAFRLDAATIPIDHAQILTDSLLSKLPWLEEEENTGVHMIHVAASGNGWQRPEDIENESLCLSKRTRLNIRIPRSRIEDAMALTGDTLDIDGTEIKVGASQIKLLSDSTTIFSRYIVSDSEETEDEFMQRQQQEMSEYGIKVKKMLCGMQNVFNMDGQQVHTKSIMLAELTPGESVQLQMKGLGARRISGFGLFIAHRGIAAVFSGNE